MAGYYETQVRRAMLTVGDTDVLNEMAAGWRSSIPALREVEDELTAGIRGLRGHDQLGEQTRDAAVGAFRDLREHLVEQRRLLGRTAQALDAAGEVIGQVKALVRVWDRVGAPRPPGPAPQPTADSDQTAYLAEVTLHHRASARHAFQVQQREEEAREAWEALNRVFAESEDKIRSAHGIPREDPTNEPEPVWPPPGWPGTPPPETDPDWPVLPPWPPVRTTGTVPGPGGGSGTGGGPSLGPGAVPGADPGSAHPAPPGGAPQPDHHPQAPGWGHDAPPTTTVAGTPQGGVAYASGAPAATAGLAAPTAPAGAGLPMPPPLAMPGGGMPGAAAAGAGVAGAGARAGVGAGAGAARAGQAGGASGRGSRAGRTAAGAVGGKGSQQASGRAKAGRGGAARTDRGASAGSAGSRGGRRKDRSAPSRDDLLGTDDHWLDDEGTAPDVLR